MTDLALLPCSVDDLPRRGAPLATLDHALMAAVRKEGVALFKPLKWSGVAPPDGPRFLLLRPLATPAANAKVELEQIANWVAKVRAKLARAVR